MSLHPLFTQEHEELRQQIRRFVETELQPHALDWEREGDFPDWIFKRMGDLGYLGLRFPPEYGGQGGDWGHAIVLAEELARIGSAGVGMAIAVQTEMASPPILRFGTEEQKQRYLPKLASGEWVGAFAITEPEAGSDAAGIKSTARRDGDHFVINGSKTFITNGPIADVISVVAVTDPEAASGQRMSCFIVERDTPGLEIGKHLDKSGNRSSPTSELHFTDMAVPASQLLGPEGSALWKVAFECFDWERTVMVAASLGGMEAQLRGCLDYVKERKAFGKAIAEFEMIQDKLARMRININTARWVLYHAAWLKQEGRPHMMEASIAKHHIADVAVQNALEAVQIFGGYGYIKEFPVER
ncbi:MAG: acyl-CoA dehydrogenase family protein, partial [Actinomycetota bacterium]